MCEQITQQFMLWQFPPQPGPTRPREHLEGWGFFTWPLRSLTLDMAKSDGREMGKKKSEMVLSWLERPASISRVQNFKSQIQLLFFGG